MWIKLTRSSINYYLSIMIIGINGISAQPIHRERTRVVDVCTAVTEGQLSSILIRGTGASTPDGFELADATCPAAQTSHNELPSIILLRIQSFASAKDQLNFKNAPHNREGVSGLFQALARGDLRCKRPFHTFTNDSGEIVGANGFGLNGLARCELRNAKVMILRSLE